MLRNLAPLMVALALVGGCASNSADPTRSPGHPANPESQEGLMPQASDTLAPASDVLTASGEKDPHSSEKTHSMGGKQDMGAMSNMGSMHDMGSMNQGTGMKNMGTMNHQDMGHDMSQMNQGVATSGAASQPATTQSAATYTCTMHPEVVSNAPGKCPKCGMKLIKKAR